MVLGLPKTPKLEDLVAALAELDSRTAALEAWREQHTASMRVRQQQVNSLREKLERDRWLTRLRKGH